MLVLLVNVHLSPKSVIFETNDLRFYEQCRIRIYNAQPCFLDLGCRGAHTVQDLYCIGSNQVIILMGKLQCLLPVYCPRKFGTYFIDSKRVKVSVNLAQKVGFWTYSKTDRHADHYKYTKFVISY